MDKNQDNGFKQLLHDQKERLKELACINRTNAILKEGKSIDETLQSVVHCLPPAWQYPEFTVARITYRQKVFMTSDFEETEWVLRQNFKTINNITGSIEVFYTKKFQKSDIGPFLLEEKELIENLAGMIVGFINSALAREMMDIPDKPSAGEEVKPGTSSRQLLQRFLERHNAERDIFHDLMPFKVKEILLVANLYDAYSIEGEGRFSEYIFGEYHQLNLTSMPRVTGVSGLDEAMERLRAKHYDLIIVMLGVEKENPMKLCKRIKQKYPYIPTFLLLNSPGDVDFIKKKKEKGFPYDDYFVWTGETRVFFAMVKLLEDRVNVENDTRKGLTRVIMLVEDSADYYSKYLPTLYTLVMEQTKHLIEEVSSDELYKVLKMRARPKILLATTYEEALAIYNRYKNNMLCVISDMRFPKDNEVYDQAGYELIKHVKNDLPNLPTVLQSSDPQNSKYAHSLKSNFINKNSNSLLQDLRSFINYYLGFGHFVYRDNMGRQIAVAKSMNEFEKYLKTIPEDSLVYHAMKNHFSLWLMARGEVKIAKIINPMKISDFSDLSELRNFLLDLISKRRRELDKGKVVNFVESAAIDETNVVSLASGSLGGKGRGLAFINTLIYGFELGKLTPGINIKSPITMIIGTDEFDLFIETNKLRPVIREEADYESLKRKFLNSNLSYNLVKKLKSFLKMMDKPLAIRSSSLFEDSMSQPFSGIFGTYLLPNNNEDFDERMKIVSDAIKLVFASIYSKSARSYFEAINYMIEQEKMAIVLQEVVGNRYGDAFYPHISGTAQSYNFYPVAHMKPDEGFAVAAIGLGQYVVEGEKAFRFSPAYPSLDIVSQKDIYKNSQVYFYAVDMKKEKINLLEGENAGLVRLDISDAEKHGTLKHCASVYNPDNDTIEPGIDSYGPRVVNFANILRYDYAPLAETLSTVLDVVKEAFGTPVEIEYAVDLNLDKEGKASFYLLQVKPLVGSGAGYNINLDKVDKDRCLLISRKSMGNGKISNISDVIYIDPESFDNTRTEEMAAEIESINDRMMKEGRKYVLIGPGRWGTRDKFIGIPVMWPQISQAKVIVEVSLPDFPLDASLGSHFFHNVTSMNVGYFSIDQQMTDEFVRWDRLEREHQVDNGKFFKHIRFKSPMVVRMDGKKRISIIECTECS